MGVGSTKRSFSRARSSGLGRPRAENVSVGDRVRLRLDSHIVESPADVYTISRALPFMANVWQYRVKRVGDGQERAVNEQ